MTYINIPVTSPLSCPPDQVLVSVIIPAFNAAATIARAIESVRSQRRVRGIEIIIIDDGSSDDTLEVIHSQIRAGENISVHKLPSNRGVSAARNVGIASASGKYLAFLDADDIWLGDKLTKQIALIESAPGIALVSCNSQLRSAAGVALKEGHVNRPPVEGDEAWKTLLIYNFLPTPTVLTHTSFVKELGGFDESLPVGEDLDLWIKLGIRGKIVIHSEILINYYDMNNSLMKRHHAQSRAIVVPMLEKHIKEQSAKLTAAEVRHIRGRHSFQIGCDIFFSGNYRSSIPLFVQSALHGTRPIKSMSYVPRAIAMELVGRVKQAAGFNK